MLAFVRNFAAPSSARISARKKNRRRESKLG